MKIQVDTMIPSSRLVPTCLNKGRPVVLEEPDSEVADSIRRLASRFIGAPSAEEGGELAPTPSAGEAPPLQAVGGQRHVARRSTGQGNTERPDRPDGSRANRVQERLVETLGPRLYDATLSDSRARGPGPPAPSRAARRGGGGRSPRRRSSSSFVRSGTASWGLGPLEPFVRDPDVTEIMVNSWDSIYVERAGKIYWTGAEVPRRRPAPPDHRQDRRPGSVAGSTSRRRTWTRACPTARA